MLVDMLVVQRSSKYQKEVDLCEKVVNEQYLVTLSCAYIGEEVDDCLPDLCRDVHNPLRMASITDINSRCAPMW